MPITVRHDINPALAGQVPFAYGSQQQQQREIERGVQQQQFRAQQQLQYDQMRQRSQMAQEEMYQRAALQYQDVQARMAEKDAARTQWMDYQNAQAQAHQEQARLEADLRERGWEQRVTTQQRMENERYDNAIADVRNSADIPEAEKPAIIRDITRRKAGITAAWKPPQESPANAIEAAQKNTFVEIEDDQGNRAFVPFDAQMDPSKIHGMYALDRNGVPKRIDADEMKVQAQKEIAGAKAEQAQQKANEAAIEKHRAAQFKREEEQGKLAAQIMGQSETSMDEDAALEKAKKFLPDLKPFQPVAPAPVADPNFERQKQQLQQQVGQNRQQAGLPPAPNAPMPSQPSNFDFAPMQQFDDGSAQFQRGEGYSGEVITTEQESIIREAIQAAAGGDQGAQAFLKKRGITW